MTFYESLISYGYSPEEAYRKAYGEPQERPPRRPWADSKEAMELEDEC